MTRRLPCPAAPSPLEGYAARFDDLFGSLAQRRGFREYLAGLLAPRDRNKALTALAGAKPVAGAQHPAVQRLQFFLSESRWDADQVNSRRLELLLGYSAPSGFAVATWMQTTSAPQVRPTSASSQRCLRSCMRAVVRPVAVLPVVRS